MPISKKVEKFLGQHHVVPIIVSHKTVYTVYDLAQTLRTKFESIAKTLLVKADKDYFLVVMPANYRLDMQKFKKMVKAKKVSLASERDMKNKFNARPGAMLPFGALHKIEVIADKSLTKTKEALFSAGSFTESLRMQMKDYLRIAEPRIAQIAKKFPMELTIVAKKLKKKKHVAKKIKKSSKRKVSLKKKVIKKKTVRKKKK